MKLLKIVILFTFSIACFSVSAQCPPVGITTNPDGPVNPQNSNFVNDFFDWRTEFFQVNSNFINASQVYSPYSPNLNNNSNTFHLTQNVDNLPTDGWELIAWDFGIDENGNFENPAAGNIHFILYNKYTSLLRIFVAGQDNNAYNSSTISMRVFSTSEEEGEIIQPSLLHDPNNIYGLDKHYTEPLLSASSFMNGMVSNWFYADFFINYDPCVCLYESAIEFSVRHISNSTITVNGISTGEIVQVSNGQGSTTNGFTIDYQDLISGGKKAYKAYQSTDKFVEDQLKSFGVPLNTPDNQLTAEQLKKKQALTKLQTSLISGAGFIGVGFAAMPYLAVALELVKFFNQMATPSSSPAAPKPMAINSKLSLQGTISTINPYISPTYYTPGSLNSNQTTNSYPYYNEVLGVFNILETPKLKLNITQTANTNTQIVSSQYPVFHYIYTDFVTENITFELNKEELKYTFNPILNLNDDKVEIMGTLHFESNTMDLSAITPPYQVKRVIYETEMFPIKCLFNSKFERKSQYSVTQEQITNFNNNPNTTYTITEVPNNGNYYDNSFAPDYTYMSGLNGVHNRIIFSPLTSFQRDFQPYLKLYVSFEKPDGTKALQVFAYPLEVIQTSTFNKPTMYTGSYPPSLFLENIELTQDLSAYNIVVGNNVTVAPNTTITLTAGSQIIVIPDAVLDPELILQVSPPSGCYALPNNIMQTPTAVNTFCQSNAYKGIRNKTTFETEEKPVFEADNFTFNLFPNPSTADTWLTYSIAEEATVRILITDMMGKMIENSREQVQAAGDYQVQLNTSNLSKGYYHCTLLINGVAQTKKLILQ
jgi:hypothetical protein